MHDLRWLLRTPPPRTESTSRVSLVLASRGASALLVVAGRPGHVLEPKPEHTQDPEGDGQGGGPAGEEPRGRAPADANRVGQAGHAVQLALDLPADQRPATADQI